MTNSGASAGDPGNAHQWITDGVSDQTGRLWVKVAIDGGGRWILRGELSKAAILEELATAGARCLQATSRRKLLEAAENYPSFRPGLVAPRPGWLRDKDGTAHFVRADGKVFGPAAGTDVEVIVTFSAVTKFKPKGKLKVWQKTLWPLVKGQTLPVFVLCCALVPLLREFAAQSYENQTLDLSGPTSCGKSSLARLAASLWAGDPSREMLGGETWLATPEALEGLMAVHADALLVLDEANHAGTDRKSQSAMLGKARFRLAGSEGKERWSTGRQVSGVRSLIISTSNDRLTQTLEASADVKEAMTARGVTLPISLDGDLRVFNRLPKGYADTGAAIEAMRAINAQNYGTPAQAFIRELVQASYEDERQLKADILFYCEEFRRKADVASLTGAAARAAKLFELTFAAAKLARRWKIVPANWGRSLRVVRRVFRAWRRSMVADAVGPNAAARLWAALKAPNPDWVAVETLTPPLTIAEFMNTPGILVRSKDGLRLVVPPGILHKALPGHRRFLSDLHKQEIVVGERGKHPKVTGKPPHGIVSDSDRARARCYTIKLDLLRDAAGLLSAGC